MENNYSLYIVVSNLEGIESDEFLKRLENHIHTELKKGVYLVTYDKSEQELISSLFSHISSAPPHAIAAFLLGEKFFGLGDRRFASESIQKAFAGL